MDRYYSFNRYLRETFGQRVHRLSLDAGFSCPNIDGTKGSSGCIFCDNKAFSRFSGKEKIPLEKQIAQSMEIAARRFNAKKFIAYFQSFSNTYSDINFLKQQYSHIRKFDNIVGLAISTRPDCVDEEKLEFIDSFSKDYKVYIEYGLQTVHNKTLESINRNHTFADFEKAVELTRRYKNINIGVHVILGLPYETKDDMFQTAVKLSRMPLWGIKFHCLHVIKNTLLEEWYKSNKIEVLSEDEYIDILIAFLRRVPQRWVVLRLVSDANRDFLLAPGWINDKQRVLKKINEGFVKRDIKQGDLYEGSCDSGK
jgi:radical SAM protein (TIGR01212 family)